MCVAGWLIYSILFAHPLAHLIGKVQSQPVLSSDESVLYVGSGDGDTYIHSLRADDGSEIWRYSAAGGKKQMGVYILYTSGGIKEGVDIYSDQRFRVLL